MLEKFRVIFTIPELRNKILLTLFLLAIYRVGWHIPLPVVNQVAMRQQAQEQQNSGFSRILDQVAIFSASQLNKATIFGLGIMPYISASIIFQLLGSVWKPIEELQKEGETGRKKINEYTRYLTVVLCLIQSFFFVRLTLATQDGGQNPIDFMFQNDNGGPGLALVDHFGAHHDLRQRVSHVARRADRRARHWQWH